MKGDNGHDEKGAVSRRGLLRAGGFALGATLLGAAAASAQEGEPEKDPPKTPQKDAAYQPKPLNKSKCLICRHYQPPSGCRLVEGPISPDGWCKLYVMSWALPS